jgi:hypothetical protein
MAHYARININTNIVEKVIVAEDDLINTFPDANRWIKTSYNTHGGIHYDPITGNPSEDQSKALRKNFASVGYTYDQTKDAFIPPKEYASWTLNETTCNWEAPIPRPELTQEQIDNNNYYKWNEENQTWDLV